MATYRVIGVMSGTSLDGMDVCCVDFTRQDANSDSWTFKLIRAKCYPYSVEWRSRLSAADSLSGEQLIKLHIDYSHHVGHTVQSFITATTPCGDDSDNSAPGEKNQSELCGIELCACHGHTVFHQPHNGFTFQLGDGETIATYLKCPVVTNFRSRDVAAGGQGAPLVPVGERHLYPDYELCLNLGGISNISCRTLSLAYDIGPCNMLLNELAARHDPIMTYDLDGRLARCGLVDTEIMVELAALEYYSMPPPKSLGKEWFDSQVLPIIDRQHKYAVNLLRTSVEHIASEIARSVKLLTTKLLEQQDNTSSRDEFCKRENGNNNNSSNGSCRTNVTDNNYLTSVDTVDNSCVKITAALTNSYTKTSEDGTSNLEASSNDSNDRENNCISSNNATEKNNCSESSSSSLATPVRILVTGGGAHNGFLMERIRALVDDLTSPSLVVWDTVMDSTAVDFKEATVFAFHGLRRVLGMINVDRRITGARIDSIAGCVSLGVVE